MPDSYIGSTNDSYSFRTGSTPVSGSIAYCNTQIPPFEFECGL